MATKTETRKLTVHPAILHSIIKAQAGSLSKALLEGVMNSVDAGSTKCAITLTADRFEIKDNGRGIASREEIEKFFENFGQPHVEGDATYGRYRMGRGQLFSFAVNTWRTGKFTMVVDIQSKGLDWELTTEKRVVKGCAIEGQLYEPLSPWQLQECLSEFKKFVAYVNIPVTLNGTLISKDPAKQKWDLETDDAYIKLSAGRELAVYNLGVLVKEYGAYQLGSGGIVVSKLAFQVNFARNDILQHACQVWKRVREVVRKHAGVKVAKKATLSDSDRQFLANQFRAVTDELDYGQWSELSKPAIVPTAAGRNASLAQLLSASAVVLVPAQHKRYGERLHRSKAIFGVTEETLDRFGVETVADLLDLVKKRAPIYYRNSCPAKVGNIEDFLDAANCGFLPVPEADMTLDERVAFGTLLDAHRRIIGPWLAKLGEDSRQLRTLAPGESDAALAWTDAKTSIHVERSFLTKCARKGIDGWYRMGAVLVHEYCHSTPDLEGHEHDQSFYELFEELATTSNCPLGSFAAYCAQTFNAKAVAQGVKLSRSMLFSTNRLAKDVVADNDAAPTAHLQVAAKVIDAPIPSVAKGQLSFLF